MVNVIEGAYAPSARRIVFRSTETSERACSSLHGSDREHVPLARPFGRTYRIRSASSHVPSGRQTSLLHSELAMQERQAASAPQTGRSLGHSAFESHVVSGGAATHSFTSRLQTSPFAQSPSASQNSGFARVHPIRATNTIHRMARHPRAELLFMAIPFGAFMLRLRAEARLPTAVGDVRTNRMHPREVARGMCNAERVAWCCRRNRSRGP